MRNANRRGFTLVELLVSMSIFGIITGFVTANFRAGGRGDELRLSSQYVASEIRRAQTMVVGSKGMSLCVAGDNIGKRCASGTNNECGAGNGVCKRSVPLGGYGVHFSTVEADNRKMVLFADINADGRYQVDEAIRTTSISPSTFVHVTELSPNDTGLDIVFRPPDADAWLNGGTSLNGSVRINSISIDTPKYVRINVVSGQISAD